MKINIFLFTNIENVTVDFSYAILVSIANVKEHCIRKVEPHPTCYSVLQARYPVIVRNALCLLLACPIHHIAISITICENVILRQPQDCSLRLTVGRSTFYCAINNCIESLYGMTLKGTRSIYYTRLLISILKQNFLPSTVGSRHW